MKFYFPLLALLCLLVPFKNFSQTPGIIVRPAGSNGPAVLDPNADGYTSAATSGFGTDDIATSEIPYKVVPPVISEPTGDLLRGPSGRFSDIVKKVDGSGFYLYNDGTNLLCRLRIGGIVSGSKGYSILLDTDSKFGNSGAYADPNYMAATNGNNGNPGFELEVVLETNSRVAVYNVDGTSTPLLLNSYSISTNSQISVAGSVDGNDPDYFYDFHVPYSALGITASTPIRATATTVMAPKAAIGGPKSDIYGVAGKDYMDDWTTAILAQPPFTLDSLTISHSGVSGLCSAAPVLNSPVLPTSTVVTGTWTKATNSSISSAVVTLYKGTIPIGTSMVSSGGAWSISVSGLANADVLTAKAQGAGESMCLSSNTVTVNACNSSNSPATPTLTCSSGSKGINGTNLSSNWTVHVDNMTRNTANNSVTNTGALFGSTSGASPNITWQYSGGCSSGAPLTSGSYKIYYTNGVTGCNSQPAYFCSAGNGPNALAGSVTAPVITTPSSGVYTTATTSISGTTTAGATLSLYVDGTILQTTTATGVGAFTFSGLALLTGQQLFISVEKNSGAVNTSYCASKTSPVTVTCFTSPPLIAVGNTSLLVTTSAITGTSTEVTGTIIKVYTSANTLVATTAVQSDGSWSTGNAGTTPAVYNAVSGTSYYANAKNGTCGFSANSATFATAGNTSSARCGTLPAAVSESASSISGTLSGTALPGSVITLYADGSPIGTITTANSVWGPIAVNTTVDNTLYAGAVLTIGITEPSKNEVLCAATVTVSCTPPTAPLITPSSTTIAVGQTVTYTISSPQPGVLYSLRDNSDAVNIGASTFGSGSSASIVSDPFNTAGTFTVNVKATSFSGPTCQSLSSATVVVSGILPVTMLNLDGTYNKQVAKLRWSTSSEHNVDFFEIQRSYTGDNYKMAALIQAAGLNGAGHYYEFSDSSLTSAVVYYRLKMVDKNNDIRYSKVIALHAAEGISNSISPNPFLDFINITVSLDADLPLTIFVTDLEGRKLKSIYYQGKTGLNNISLTDLNALSRATYLLEINSKDRNLMRQLIIK